MTSRSSPSWDTPLGQRISGSADSRWSGWWCRSSLADVAALIRSDTNHDRVPARLKIGPGYDQLGRAEGVPVEGSPVGTAMFGAGLPTMFSSSIASWSAVPGGAW